MEYECNHKGALQIRVAYGRGDYENGFALSNGDEEGILAVWSKDILHGLREGVQPRQGEHILIGAGLVCWFCGVYQGATTFYAESLYVSHPLSYKDLKSLAEGLAYSIAVAMGGIIIGESPANDSDPVTQETHSERLSELGLKK